MRFQDQNKLDQIIMENPRAIAKLRWNTSSEAICEELAEPSVLMVNLHKNIREITKIKKSHLDSKTTWSLSEEFKSILQRISNINIHQFRRA